MTAPTPHLDAARAHRLAAEANGAVSVAGRGRDQRAFDEANTAAWLATRAAMDCTTATSGPDGMYAARCAVSEAQAGSHFRAKKWHIEAAEIHQRAAERDREGLDNDGEQIDLAPHTEACDQCRAQGDYTVCDVQYCALCGQQAYECRMALIGTSPVIEYINDYSCDRCRGEVAP